MNSEKHLKLAVKAVILDADDRCLVLRRSSANRGYVGYWEWPGGKPDPGEDFATALRREVQEECGLQVVFTGLAGASEFEMPAANVVLLCLLARQTSGELRLSHEHDAFEWVRLDELTQRRILEPMRPVLKNLLKHKESHG
jgi:8-oxo-dGTP diphosphatase